MSKVKDIVDELDLIFKDTIFKFTDHLIGGKLVISSVKIPVSLLMQVNNDTELKDTMKQTMAKNLVAYMISENLIEFTQRYDPSSQGYELHARCYIAPDSQVKILRTHP
jgi:hypothetical protein